MSTCYLYAIVQTADRARGLLPIVGPGLEEQRLRVVTHHALAAVISDWPATAQKKLRTPNEDELWRHERVIEGFMQHLPTLPVRYGTTLPTEEHVQQLLATREADFIADLTYVTGRVEMGLRVLWDPPVRESELLPEAAPLSGRRYLEQQLQKRKQEQVLRMRGELLAQALNCTLEPLFFDHQSRILLTERLLLSGAYLVERRLVDAFQAQVASLEQTYPDLAFLVTGPWPAYHFVRNPQQIENL